MTIHGKIRCFDQILFLSSELNLTSLIKLSARGKYPQINCSPVQGKDGRRAPCFVGRGAAGTTTGFAAVALVQKGSN